MNERVMQRRVGIVALSTLVIGALLVGLNSPAPLAWLPWGRGSYPVNVEVDQAPGVAPNTPVRKNGLLIGRVESVQDLPDRIVITANIDEGVELFPQYTCQVRTSMLGDSTLEFFRARVPPETPPVPPGWTFQGSVISSNPLDMMSGLQGGLSQTVTALGIAGDEVAQLAQTVNQVFEDEEGRQRLEQLIDQGLIALDDFSRTMRSIEEVLADDELRENLKRGLSDLPGAITDARRTMEEAQQAMNTIERVATNVDDVVLTAERNLRNMEGFTKPLGESGAQIADAVLAGADGIDRLLEEISVFARTLSASEGTFGRLVRDRELYDNLNQLALNANLFFWRLNELGPQLRKIANDASIFTDKIAREPGRLVGGALNRGPGIK